MKKFWIAFGAIAGLGLENKYSIGIFICALLLGLEVQERLGLQGAQERDRGRVHRELHRHPPWLGPGE